MVVWLYAWMPCGGRALRTAWKTESRGSWMEGARARYSNQEQTPTSYLSPTPNKAIICEPIKQSIHSLGQNPHDLNHL